MIFITGGTAQGKEKYAKEKFGAENITDGADCDISSLNSVQCVKNYHELVKRLMSAGTDPVVFTKNFCAENKEAIVIMNEIGCGIVPLSREEREWRENTGVCGCIIAENSDIAVRMVCGIPTVIK